MNDQTETNPFDAKLDPDEALSVSVSALRELWRNGYEHGKRNEPNISECRVIERVGRQIERDVEVPSHRNNGDFKQVVCSTCGFVFGEKWYLGKNKNIRYCTRCGTRLMLEKRGEERG